MCRAGVEPAQRSRALYRRLGSPIPCRHVSALGGIRTRDLRFEKATTTPLVRQGVRMAQVRFELTASLVLSESGLPVAYRADSRVPRGSRTRLTGLKNQRLRRSAKGTRCSSGRRGSRTLKAQRSSGFGPDAVAHRLALPCQSGWLESNQRSPAPEAGGFASLPHPDRNSRSRLRVDALARNISRDAR